MLAAKQQKETLDYQANSNERTAKYDADSAAREDKLGIDLSYRQNIFDANSAARSSKLEAEQHSDEGKFAAELKYMDDVMKNEGELEKYRAEKADAATKAAETQRADREKAFYQLYDIAKSGDYSAEELGALARRNGLVETDIIELMNVAENAKRSKQGANEADLSGVTGNSISAIEAAIKSGAVSPEVGNQMITDIQTKNYNEYSALIKAAAADPSYAYLIDTKAMDSAYSKGDITKEQYESLKRDYDGSIDKTSNYFLSGEGTYLSKSSAASALEKTLNDPWVSGATKAAVKAVYDAFYTPIDKGVVFYKDTWNDQPGEKGNNFTVKKDGKTYDVQYGGEADANIKEIAYDLHDNTVFGYQGATYIKKGSSVYIVEKRTSASENPLYNIFFGGGDPTSKQSANEAGAKAFSSYSEGATFRTDRLQ